MPTKGFPSRPKSILRKGALAQEIPKMGVFLCHCGEELKKILSIPDLIEAAKSAREVAHVEEVGLACLPEDLDLIKRRIGEQA